MQETWVQSLGWEDLLEKEMAPHSSILAWKIPWTKEPAGYSPWGHKELDTTERLHFHLVIPLWHCPSLASFSVEFNVSFSRLIFLLCFMATTPSPSWFWSTSCYSSLCGSLKDFHLYCQKIKALGPCALPPAPQPSQHSLVRHTGWMNVLLLLTSPLFCQRHNFAPRWFSIGGKEWKCKVSVVLIETLKFKILEITISL